MIYTPRADAAIGNLSLVYSTHMLMTGGKGAIHPDAYKYGRDKSLIFTYVSDDGVIEEKGFINGFIHLRFPQISVVMQDCIKPTASMQNLIDTAYTKIKDCVAGFHIRRGMYGEDSSKFAYYPFSSDEAVEAMIKVANEMDKPVFVISDSIVTKKYFQSKVPKAISLDLEIGFTACEFSQEYAHTVKEDSDLKMNSILEWFMISKMPKVYTTMGGVCGRNVPEGTIEGLSSTFGYSAALYGGKIPYYVFNDGYVFYPDGEIVSNRLSWSDSDTGRYIVINEPTKEKIINYRSTHPMWKLLVNPVVCKELGIYEWCDKRVNVEFDSPAKIKNSKEMKFVD